MTAILPERPAVLAAALPHLADEPPETQATIGTGLLRALDLAPRPHHEAPSWATDPDFRASAESGLTETYEAYCDRISKETPRA